MIKKILLGLLVLVLAFMGFVATRPSHFHIERSGVINASADVVFPYLNDLKRGGEWVPFEKTDPNLKRTFSGPETGVGSVLQFAGNSEAGEGRLEILKVVPGSAVDIKLEMFKPFSATHLVEYRLAPEGAGTKFTWAMSGEMGFLNKLVGVFMNCDKMIGGEFEKGILTLKTLVEGKKS